MKIKIEVKRWCAVKQPLIIKILRAVIIAVSVFAAGHILYYVFVYDSIFTALPMWLGVVLEAACWAGVILVMVIVYLLVLKHYKNKQQ